MSLPPEDDAPEVRAAFSRQREGDHAEAPAWRDEWLRAPLAGTRERRRLHWIPVTLATASFVLAAMLSLPAFKTQPQARLSEVLPPLFEEGAPAGGLFADLGPASSPSSFMSVESPSDFLLPEPLSPSPDIHLFLP